jgi:hypothetical protein
MKTTVSGEVNRNSPQIGQSHSVFLSMQRWDPWRDIDMHTLHVCIRWEWEGVPCSERNLFLILRRHDRFHNLYNDILILWENHPINDTILTQSNEKYLVAVILC